MDLRMSTTELNSILSNCRFTRDSFIGTFPSDVCPEVVFKRPLSIVWNTALSDSPGDHWVACYFSKNGIAYYFDSGGTTCPPNICAHIKKFTPRMTHVFSRPIQHVFSSVCGHYCIFFLIMLGKQMGLERLKRLFLSKTLKNNDLLIKHWFEKHMKTCESIAIKGDSDFLKCSFKHEFQAAGHVLCSKNSSQSPTSTP